jgi:ribosomal protein S18 acetylase RimI-like enzyme/ADP-ribose pyrophosphatase YjhB (NUDIX family)
VSAASTGALQIRRYRDADAGVVVRLHDEALAPTGAHLPGPWNDDLNDVPRVYLNAGGEFLVGELEGKVVAMGALRRVDDATAEVKRMRVFPAQQRRGFGAAILGALENRARELGYVKLVLDTSEQQVAARALYERHGFREVGTRPWQGWMLRVYEKWLNVRPRPVSRLVVLDPHDRILLFETRLDYTHVWITPGGGVQPGESFVDGARRELWEEVGVRDVEIGPWIWTVEFRFERAGTVIDQHERYFVVRLPSDAVHDANREAKERTEILRHRWWTLAELGDAATHFRPRELAALLPAVIAGRLPSEPTLARVEASAVVV